MKFLIQKINNEIRHDFAFTLLESVRFQNWLQGTDDIGVRFLNTEANDNDEVEPFDFKNYHHSYVPIGSVEFVTQFLEHFHGLTPKPINVPESLYPYANRRIFVGDNHSLQDLKGRWVIKSMDKIKGLLKEVENPDILSVPPGGDTKYQISQYISIESEWRAFIYKGRLRGLQHYVGDFTLFPSVNTIKSMIQDYKDAPVAYTLDIGITHHESFPRTVTCVIEVHDFFSCGLYGFSDHSVLSHMFGRWFNEYLTKNKTQ